MPKIYFCLPLPLLLIGCVQVPAVPNPPPATMTTWGPYGGFTMSSGANCAGQATLTNGKTVVADSCFTSAENVVLCTDSTAPSAVSCAPTAGELNISGFGSDQVAYARVR